MAETKEKEKNEGILEISAKEQYRTVDELFKKSQESSAYYTMLGLSALIISLGLLLNNLAIVIGGMLVAPVLTPMLLIGLGFSLGEVPLIRRISLLMIKSFLLVLILSATVAVLYGGFESIFNIENTVRAAVLYFIVALASGVAGTFALARKELSEVLPGIAVAITLVPPLALIGIWLSAFRDPLSFTQVRFYLLIFLINLVGIIMGSIVVFSLLNFYRLKKKVAQKTEEAEEEDEKKT
jgi:uncharacterized hydrophobic protein (TIGR00271 family)